MSDPTREGEAPDEGGGGAPDASDGGGTGTAGGADSTPDADAAFPPDEERRDRLRAVAEDVRGESSESKQLSAVLYRVSDLYDPDEDTSPEEIYRAVRTIVRVKERGGLRREE